MLQNWISVLDGKIIVFVYSQMRDFVFLLLKFTPITLILHAKFYNAKKRRNESNFVENSSAVADAE